MEFAAFLASADSQLLRFQLRNITPAATSLANHPDIRASIVAKAEADTINRYNVAEMVDLLYAQLNSHS